MEWIILNTSEKPVESRAILTSLAGFSTYILCPLSSLSLWADISTPIPDDDNDVTFDRSKIVS